MCDPLDILEQAPLGINLVFSVKESQRPASARTGLIPPSRVRVPAPGRRSIGMRPKVAARDVLLEGPLISLRGCSTNIYCSNHEVPAPARQTFTIVHHVAAFDSLANDKYY